MTAQTQSNQMQAEQLQQKYVGWFLKGIQGLLVIVFALMLITALHPDVRSQVRGAILKDYRTVVSVAEGDLAGHGSHFKVTKIKTRDALLLEIYRIDGTSQKLVEKIEMPDARDGYFNFNGQATNLAIDDIDGDGKAEILVPTFDKNLVGRLNIYHFDPEAQKFESALR